LRETFIQFKPLENGGGALVNNDYIVVDNYFANNPRALRRILIHEIQHWIQNVEGWHTGSAEQYFQDDKSERVQRLDEVLERKEYIVSEIKRIEASGDFKEVSKKMIQDLIDGKISDAEFDTRYEQLLSNTQAEYGQRSLKDLVEEKAALIAEEMELTDAIANESNLTAYDKYMRTAGEVEARNAEKRQTELTAEQRRKIPPEATQDFPYEEQIVFEGGNSKQDALRPQDIDSEVAKNINSIMGKIAYIRDNNLPTDMQSIKKICSDELKPVAKLSQKWFKWYQDNYGATSPYVYSSEAYLVEHHFRRHFNTEISRYLLLPNTIYDPQNVKDTTDQYGDSQSFIRKYDKWVSTTIKPYLDVDESGRIVMFKNFYKDKRMPYKNKPDIDISTSGSSMQSYAEDALPSIVNASKRNDPSRRNNFSGVPHDKELLLDESSENSPESQAHFSLGEEELSEKEKAKLYKQKRARELITSVAMYYGSGFSIAYARLFALQSFPRKYKM
jgi:hypothetical protein